MGYFSLMVTQIVSRPTSCLKWSITSSDQDVEGFIEVGLEKTPQIETAQTHWAPASVLQSPHHGKYHSVPLLFQCTFALAQLTVCQMPGSFPPVLLPGSISVSAGTPPAQGRAAHSSCLTFHGVSVDFSSLKDFSSVLFHCKHSFRTHT